MIDSYFKVALPLVSKQDTSPRSVREEFPPAIGCFPFDSSDADAVAQAYNAASAFKGSIERSGRRAFLSVWKQPKITGPWSWLYVVGVSRLVLAESEEARP